MSVSPVLIITIIIVALVFDFLNGFHDAANSIATVVATKVLSPVKAVVLAATCNFVAAFFFEVHVAKTMASGIVHADLVTPIIVLAGLSGAIVWNIITWYFGLPTSSSHALIGGFAGSALTAMWLKTGSLAGVLNVEKLLHISRFIVLSPMFGMFLGFALMLAVMWLFRRANPRRLDGWFRVLQLFSAGAYSLSHGTNDAQKTMGIITILLFSAGWVDHTTPDTWVILSCHAAIALGTLSGGWRIVKTMGLGITKLKPVGGFCAETAGAITVFGASAVGIPVSTTHTITGAIVGVGATNRLSAVRWGVAGRIVWAWVLTMPLAGLMAGLTYALIHFTTP